MRFSEWLAVGYFAYLLAPIALSAQTRRVRLGLAAVAVGMILAIAAVSGLPGRDPWAALRDWAPCVYLLAGYWLPGRLFSAPNHKLERWLLCLDERLFSRVSPLAGLRHRFFRAYLEFSYLLCYPLVPAAFAIAYQLQGDPAIAADRFWRVILPAVFVCYGLVPWVPMRPPRALPLGSGDADGSVRRLNLLVLRHASIQMNTFPSGHAAAAVASALVVGQLHLGAGLIFGTIALSIAIGSVVGRYHYAADALLGALVAATAFAAFG
jgi:hypothetical protein